MIDDQPGPRRWALLIGIDDYQYLPEGKLHGCVNDVNAMASLLEERFSFPPANVRRLLDKEATREGIRAAVEELVAKIGDDDILVLHYSGHGSRMPDREGDSPDGKDETIVPYDSGRRDPHECRDIHDGEIHDWLLRLTARTPYVTLIFDCCHSGHVARDAFGAQSRWLEPEERPLAGQGLVEVRRSSNGRGESGPSGWRLPLSRRYALLAGCRSKETAFEVRAKDTGGPAHGALTFHLCRELANASPTTTLRDLHEVVATQVSAQFPTQHPTLEGAVDRQVFGVVESEPFRFVAVDGRTGDQVTLRAGAACGLTEGSTWQVYPPGTKSLDGTVGLLGRLEVTQVGVVSSTARIVAGTDVSAGCRAVEETHRYGEARLDVEIATPAKWRQEVAELRRAAEGRSLLRLVESQGDVRVYLLPARPAVRPGEQVPVPAVGALDEDSWAVVGQHGELLMPLVVAHRSDAVARLLDNLERWARHKLALVIEAPPGLLTGKVRLQLLRQAGGRWRDVDEEQGAGAAVPVFQIGERIAFRISHCHSDPLFFYLLNFGLVGGIGVMFPALGEQKPLDPGRTIEVGTGGDSGEIRLLLPSGFPFRGGAESIPGSGWIETAKLFATTAEADLRTLVQEGVRAGSPAAGHPLYQLLATSFSGNSFRDMQLTRVPAEDQWTVVQRTVQLVPGPAGGAG